MRKPWSLATPCAAPTTGVVHILTRPSCRLLSHTDIGPRSRCLNSDAPPAQPFQLPLPDAPTTFPNWVTVKQEIRRLLRRANNATAGDVIGSSVPYYGEAALGREVLEAEQTLVEKG